MDQRSTSCRPAWQMSACLLLLTTMPLALWCLSTAAGQSMVPQSQYVHPGDVYLGLYLPIFSRNTQTGTCKDYDFYRGGEFLMAEAFLQSVARRHQFKLGSTFETPKVGFVLMDTCHSLLRTVKNVVGVGVESLELLPRLQHVQSTSLKQDFGVQRELLSACALENRTDLGKIPSSKEANTSNVNYSGLAAVIGATTGDDVLNTSPLLSAFHIPHIISLGPGAAANNHIPECDFGDAGQSGVHVEARKSACRFEYHYLFRTVSPDVHVVKALLDVMATFNWWHVVVLTDVDSQALNLLSKFLQEVERRNRAGRSKMICVGFSAVVPNTPQARDKLDAIVDGLKRHERAQAIVMMAQAKSAMVLFNHIVSREEHIPRVWLATEWGKDYLIWGNDSIVNSTLSTVVRLWPDVPVAFQEFTRSIVKDLAEHVSSLTFEKVFQDRHNPWLCLNWGTAFECNDLCEGKFDNVCHITGGDYVNCGDVGTNPSCNLSDPFTISIDTDHIYFTSASHTVFSGELAIQALKNLWETIQRRYPNVSDADKRMKFRESANSGELLDALMAVQLPCGPNLTSWCRVFEDYSNFHTVLPSYSLMTSIVLGPGEVTMKKIGWWGVGNLSEQGRVTLLDSHRDVLNWRSLRIDNETKYPLSDCQPHCKIGEVIKMDADMCCWMCHQCTGNNYTADMYNCQPCSLGKQPNTFHTKCVPLPRTIFVPQWYIGAGLTVVLAFVTALPILITLAALIWKRNTMAMRAADPHLTFIMTIGMLLALVSLVTLYLQPSNLTCSLSRVFTTPWLLLTVVTMLLKTLRLARLWLSARKGQLLGKKWTLKTSAQIIYMSIITGIGLVLEVACAFGLGSKVEERYNDANTYLVCKQNLSQLFNDILIVLLVLLTCILAFIIRKMPTMANESQKLFLASFCISATWVLLTPIYYLSSDYLATILSLRILIQVFSMWAWIILPRLYSLKDSEQKMRRRRSRSSLVRSIHGGTEVSSMAESRRTSIDRYRRVYSQLEASVAVSGATTIGPSNSSDELHEQCLPNSETALPMLTGKHHTHEHLYPQTSYLSIQLDYSGVRLDNPRTNM